jgi:TM2 domain-containing membrane protein YozV
MKKIIFFAAAAIFMVSSCTIEKRLYNSGYHVEWNHSKKHVETNQLVQEESSSEVREVATVEVSRTADVDQVSEETVAINDVAELTVVSIDESTVSSVVESKTNSASSNVTSVSDNEKQMKAAQFKEIKKAEKSKAPSGGKSQIIAAVLCFLLGTLGIHRFYLGYTGIGVLMLLTAGCCGVLALIDFIRILMGDLQPASGRYTETF